MAEQYGQITGGFGNTQKLSGVVTPHGQIGGEVTRASVAYEKDYEILDNKPQINSVELIGDKSSEDLHIVACKTTAEWAENRMISQKGEIYIYSDASQDAQGNPVPMIKVGDGNAYIVDLPFSTAIDLRITQADIDNWNGKVSVRISGDNLIFY